MIYDLTFVWTSDYKWSFRWCSVLTLTLDPGLFGAFGLKTWPLHSNVRLSEPLSGSLLTYEHTYKQITSDQEALTYKNKWDWNRIFWLSNLMKHWCELTTQTKQNVWTCVTAVLSKLLSGSALDYGWLFGVTVSSVSAFIWVRFTSLCVYLMYQTLFVSQPQPHILYRTHTHQVQIHSCTCTSVQVLLHILYLYLLLEGWFHKGMLH